MSRPKSYGKLIARSYIQTLMRTAKTFKQHSGKQLQDIKLPKQFKYSNSRYSAV